MTEPRMYIGVEDGIAIVLAVLLFWPLQGACWAWLRLRGRDA